ncbi:MAG: B12-binding domain-containing radical SAM protein [Polyangia bacterium]
MRLLLIYPAWQRAIMKEHLQFPPLGLTMVAAMTPPEIEVAIVDENVEEIDLSQPADLVGISAMTCQAPRAYELAKIFRERGIPVVMGGHHASVVPDEAAKYVDAVVVGEVENQWAEVLADWKQGKLQKLYQSIKRPDLSKLPLPRRDLLKRQHYPIFNTVQTTRGCPFDCEFCSVTTFFGRTYRVRPVEEVVAEVRAMTAGRKRRRDRLFFFVDDNIVANPKYAKALFRALIPLRIFWVSQGTITTFCKDEEVLDLAAKSGCLALLIGFESISAENLESINKSFNKGNQYADNIKKIHKRGIGILGSFIYGLDHDDETTFRKTVKFAQDNAIDAANFSILTPYPGTRLRKTFVDEGRLLGRDWSEYHAIANQVLIKHKTLSQEALLDGTVWSWRTYYSIPSILGRFVRSPRTVLRSLIVILSYRKRAVALKNVTVRQNAPGEATLANVAALFS